jgi:glutathione S-transferase
VREVLSELELRYLLRPIARGSPRRHALRERWGDVAAPFLLDPNADVAIYGTAAVIEYLERTYGRGA